MWGRKKKQNKDTKDTNVTTVKQKTTIKEKYTVPSQNLHQPLVPEVKTSPLKNQPINSTNQYQTQPVTTSNVINNPIQTSYVDSGAMNRLSPDKQNLQNYNMNVSQGRGTGFNLGQIYDAPMVSSHILPTQNYGGIQNLDTDRQNIAGMHLGRNLYGQTGIASRDYRLQQPFPGQTVYVQYWRQNISRDVRDKFARSGSALNESNYLQAQNRNLGSTIPQIYRTDSYLKNTPMNYNSDNVNYVQTKPIVTQNINLNKPAVNTSSVLQKQHNVGHTDVVKETTIRQETIKPSNSQFVDNQTTVRQKTKIKQTYHIPANQVVKGSTIPTRDTTLNYAPLQQSNVLYVTQPIQNPSVIYPQPLSKSKISHQQKHSKHTHQNPQIHTTSNILGSKNPPTETVIKQKTKIKEKYTVPIQSTQKNVISQIPVTQSKQIPLQQVVQTPVQQSNVKYDEETSNIYQKPIISNQASMVNQTPINSYSGLRAGETKNLGYVQQKYSQPQYERVNVQPSNISANINTTPINTTTINMNTLEGSNMMRTDMQTQMMYRGTGLGKNLYGQTGYADLEYFLQQPFPGQTVYVPQPIQKISEKTKTKFMGGGI